MKYLDRITGETTSTVDPPLVHGRWGLASESSVRMNAASPERGDYLVPGFSSDRVSLRLPNAAAEQREVFEFAPESMYEGWSGARSEWPPLASALDDLSANWLPLVEDPGSWKEVARSVPPIDPSLSEELHLFRLDREIEKRLVHLQTVCQSPREQLETVTERVPVGRARKLSPRAAEHLAAHPEDWEHRSLFALVPRHVLSEMPEENLDIYENRVAARLIDRLERYLLARIRRVRTLMGTLKVAHDYTSDIQSGSQVFVHRVTRLWGEAFDLDTQDEMEATHQTLSTLTRLREDLQRLRHSPLYQAVPRTAQVDDQLEPTNLLTEHQHYRHVGHLWRRFLQRREGTPSPETHHETMLSLCRAYEAFCMMVICRTLNEKGYVPADPFSLSSLRRGAPGLTLQKESAPSEQVQIRWTENGEIALENAQWAFDFRFIPVPGRVSGSDLPSSLPRMADCFSSARTVYETMHQDAEAGSDRSIPVIAHPGETGGDDESQPQLDGGAASGEDVPLPEAERDSPRPEEVQNRRVRSSPQDLLSEERMGRVLNKWLSTNRFLQYPFLVESRRPVRDFLLNSGDWVSSANQPGVICVYNSPSEEQRDEFYAQVKERRTRLEREGQVDPFNTMVEEHVERLSTVFAKLRSLQICPVCDVKTSPKLFEAREETFVCVCEKRGCTWGLNKCGECSQTFPYVEPPGFNAASDLTSNGSVPANSEILLRHFGRDLITPIDSEGKVMCPYC